MGRLLFGEYGVKPQNKGHLLDYFQRCPYYLEEVWGMQNPLSFVEKCLYSSRVHFWRFYKAFTSD